MTNKIHGKAPHRKQIMAMKGKTKRDPRYRPGKSWLTRKAAEDRRKIKASRAGRSYGYVKK